MATIEGYIAWQAAPPARGRCQARCGSAQPRPSAFSHHRRGRGQCSRCEFQTLRFSKSSHLILSPGNRELLSQVKMTMSKVSPSGGILSPIACAHFVPSLPPSHRHLPFHFQTTAIAIQTLRANPALPGKREICSDIFNTKNPSMNIKNSRNGMLEDILLTLAPPPGELVVVAAGSATHGLGTRHQHHSGCNMKYKILKR